MQPYIRIAAAAFALALAFPLVGCTNAGPSTAQVEPERPAKGEAPPLDSQTPPTSAPASAPATIAAEASNDLALRLYRELARQDEGNLFFSPFSISSALAMTWEGARGETAEQMADVLAVPAGNGERIANARFHEAMGQLTQHFNRNGLPYELRVANALWGERTLPFREEYLAAVQPHYEAALEEMNFIQQPEQAREQINHWVEQQTNNRIQDLLAEGTITPDTRLVLTNAIYFLAAWASPFAEQLTEDRPFHVHGGDRTVPVPTMFRPNTDIRHTQADGFQLVAIPYERGDLAMVILLPDEPAGLPDLEVGLTPDRLADWLDQLRNRQANLYLPKFNVETEYQLNDTLADLGMPSAFAPDRADFTGLTDSAEGDELYIQHVVHKAFIDVDEEGTEAAAATGIVVGRLSAPVDPPLEIRVDRPFVYLIHDRAADAVLFMGRVVDPR